MLVLYAQAKARDERSAVLDKAADTLGLFLRNDIHHWRAENLVLGKLLGSVDDIHAGVGRRHRAIPRQQLRKVLDLRLARLNGQRPARGGIVAERKVGLVSGVERVVT